MVEARRRLLTRLLLLAMIVSALWGGWMIAKNGGRRGRIGPPPKQPKAANIYSQILKHQQFMYLNDRFHG
jgi:hypothetical protein